MPLNRKTLTPGRYARIVRHCDAHACDVRVRLTSYHYNILLPNPLTGAAGTTRFSVHRMYIYTCTEVVPTHTRRPQPYHISTLQCRARTHTTFTTTNIIPPRDEPIIYTYVLLLYTYNAYVYCTVYTVYIYINTHTREEYQQTRTRVYKGVHV